MKLVAIIVAGGRSSRMGREKALEEINGQSILARIISRLQPQADLVVINGRDGHDRFSMTGCRFLADSLRTVQSPIAGLHAALQFAHQEGFDFALTVPCDTPFLPHDLVSRLAASGSEAAIAASAGQSHFLTGLWSSQLYIKLEEFLSGRQIFRLQDWVAYCEAVVVDWRLEDHDPFFNVNTPEDLAVARRIASEVPA
jgi:molybdopterin-guanine dinucleotide biosynthesis protein A